LSPIQPPLPLVALSVPLEVLDDSDWVDIMHEELNNFTRNEEWELVKRPSNHNVIGTK
jgi:primosomal protein N'